MLNPQNKPGRLTLIARFGSDKIGEKLPRAVRAVQARRRRRWSGPAIPCTATPSSCRSGYKTRPFDRILEEVQSFFAVHRAEGTHAGGVHFEMTGQDVTECLGGAQAISEEVCRPLSHPLRSAAQCQPGAGACFPDRGGHARRTHEGRAFRNTSNEATGT